MKIIDTIVQYKDGQFLEIDDQEIIEKGRKETLSYNILMAHQQAEGNENLKLRFDSLTSHDITYVGIIQTARASGMEEFPLPYVLTNCHNSLCAVGGTINEDDHVFALSAARKYGGIYVPAHYAVIHSFNREMMTACGNMILGSDSHTRYGALGTMGIGEGGGELAKQLLKRTYDIPYPKVIAIHLAGKPRKSVGPHDVALALISQTFNRGILKNAVLEFVGEGIHHLSQDYRNGIDVMTTETTCLSSIWETDDITKDYYERHGREYAYQKLSVNEAVYDGCIEMDLAEIEPMIALPMHPSLALPIREFKKDPKKYLLEAQERMKKQMPNADIDLLSKVDEDGNVHIDQAVIAGCSGGIYENIVAASHILQEDSIGNGNFTLSIYPDSMPIYKALLEDGTQMKLIQNGAIIREAFCGPCFGAGDTPSANSLSIRHTTRNFPNREGSKPNEGQASAVCLMDARSIAATAKNKGILTSADEVEIDDFKIEPAFFDQKIYENRIYNGLGNPQKDIELIQGPNIKPWPKQYALEDAILTKVVSFIDDPLTTTDELIPSGETSSFRSNPLRLAEYTLSRRDPSYVNKAKDIQELSKMVNEHTLPSLLKEVGEAYHKYGIDIDFEKTTIGSSIYANKPGDGSAREQAASCQRVLGAIANFAQEYATKRYRSNCINWGILPFVTKEKDCFEGAWVYLEGIYEAMEKDKPCKAYVLQNDKIQCIEVELGQLSAEEKKILCAGSLINYYKES